MNGKNNQKEKNGKIEQGSAIKVFSFSLKSDPKFNFSYSTGGEVFTLGTNDSPTTEFNTAMENLENAAADYLGVDRERYQTDLDSAIWGDTDSTIRLDLFYPENKVSYIKMTKSKIPTMEIWDKTTGLADPSDPRNILNEALKLFQEKCVKYLLGDRKQKALPFPEQEPDKENELPFGEAQK